MDRRTLKKYASKGRGDSMYLWTVNIIIQLSYISRQKR